MGDPFEEALKKKKADDPFSRALSGDTSGDPFAEALAKPVPIKKPVYASTESTTSGGPAKSFATPEIFGDIAEAFRSAKKFSQEVGQEIKEHPVTSQARVLLGAAKRVPAFGQRLSELPLGLYSIVNPEAGGEALNIMRQQRGWDRGYFEPSTPLEKIGGAGMDIGIGALETMAPVARAATPFQRIMAMAIPSTIRGAGTQAGQAASVDIPGETPEEKAKRVRRGAIVRAGSELLQTTVPYGGALKRGLTTPVALGAEALALNQMNKFAGEVSGVPTDESYLATLGNVLGAHLIGKAVESSQPAPEAYTNLGTGEANLEGVTYGRDVHKPQLQRQTIAQTALAERMMAGGLVDRLKSRFSPEAFAKTTEYLSREQAGLKPVADAEVQAVLADPDFQNLHNTVRSRYESEVANAGGEPAPFVTPRVVTEGLPEDSAPFAGQRGVLGRAGHEGQKERTIMRAPQGQIVEALDNGEYNIWYGGKVVGKEVLDPKTLIQADIPSIEAETPFRYGRDLPTVLEKRLFAQGDVVRTRQMEQAIKSDSKMSLPKEAAPADWIEPDATAFPGLAGTKVHPEFADVLTAWKRAQSGDKGYADEFFRALNGFGLKMGFQVNPTAHWTNMVSHFVKTAVGSGKGLRYLPEAMNRAIEMERSIRMGQPNQDAIEYLQANGQLMSGSGGRAYLKGQDERMSALTGNEPREFTGGTDLTERMTWRPDDRLRMTLALMNKLAGKPMAQAVADVNQSYPDYRPLIKPTGNKPLDTVLDGLVNNPAFVFQRYRRGAYSSGTKTLSDLAQVRNLGRTSDAGTRVLSGALKSAGVAANFALLKYILSPAVQAVTRDERDVKAPGGTEHIISDFGTLASDLANNNLAGVGRWAAKNINVAPGVVFVAGNSFSDKQFNPKDLAAISGAADPKAKAEAAVSIARRVAEITGGLGAASVAGTALEGKAGPVFLLGKKREYTASERMLNDFMGEAAIPSGFETRQRNARKQLLEGIQGKADLGVLDRDVIGKGDIEAAKKTLRAKTQGREWELASRAAALPFRDYALLTKVANDKERDALFKGLGQKLKSLRKASPEDHRRALSEINEILGSAGVVKALAEEQAAPEQSPDWGEQAQ